MTYEHVAFSMPIRLREASEYPESMGEEMVFLLTRIPYDEVKDRYRKTVSSL
jgi:hypothetical protein